MKLKVLVITDSLGLPRRSGDELVPFESTWVNKLRKNVEVHQVSIGGATIYQLFEQIKYNELYEPDVVVVQSGIVDCAPRAFKMSERQLFLSIPLVSRVFTMVASRYGKNIRNLRNITYTKLDLYKTYVNKINASFNGKPVYFVGIVPAPAQYETNMKGISKNISNYNGVLKQIAGERFIDLSELTNVGLLSDHHHLNTYGNERLYLRVLEMLRNQLGIEIG